jgi:hypothetical protein
LDDLLNDNDFTTHNIDSESITTVRRRCRA